VGTHPPSQATTARRGGFGLTSWMPLQSRNRLRHGILGLRTQELVNLFTPRLAVVAAKTSFCPGQPIPDGVDNAWWQPIELLGLVAGTLGLAIALPQALKIHRLGQTDGVSVLTWFLMFASCSAWFGYGLRTASLSQASTNFIALALDAWLLLLLLRPHRWRHAVLIAVFVAMVTASLFLPILAMSALLVSFSLVRWPQAITSLRRWRARQPVPAVSYLTWSMALASTSLWGIYAIATDRSVVLAASIISATAAVLILAATAAANRRHRLPAPPA
jgi:uncharacterized protein with PQ loop repeat